MANLGACEGDGKYRSFIHGEEEKNTKWRYGGPPNYDVVNKLFEQGRTKVVILIPSEFIHIHTYLLYDSCHPLNLTSLFMIDMGTRFT